MFPNQRTWEDMFIQNFYARTHYKNLRDYYPRTLDSLSHAKGTGWVPGPSNPNFTVTAWNNFIPTMK